MPDGGIDTYWRFAAARQQVYEARLVGEAAPWTSDPILAAAPVHQLLPRSGSGQPVPDQARCLPRKPVPDEVFFRTLLFKVFNRIRPGSCLPDSFGEVSWAGYDFARLRRVLEQRLRRRASGSTRPRTSCRRRTRRGPQARQPPAADRADDVRRRRRRSRSAECALDDAAFEYLARAIPAIGDFLAYQYVIDLNYRRCSGMTRWSSSCRARVRVTASASASVRPPRIEADVIRYMADHQEEHFARLGLYFQAGLRGRPLQLIDCQNLFCEVDKYCPSGPPGGRRRSAAGPGSSRPTARSRAPLTAWFPPKWGLTEGVPPVDPFLACQGPAAAGEDGGASPTAAQGTLFDC